MPTRFARFATAGGLALACAVFLAMAGVWSYFFLFDGCLDEGTCPRTTTEHLVAACQLVVAGAAVLVSLSGMMRQWRHGTATARSTLSLAFALLGVWLAIFIVAAATGL